MEKYQQLIREEQNKIKDLKKFRPYQNFFTLGLNEDAKFI